MLYSRTEKCFQHSKSNKRIPQFLKKKHKTKQSMLGGFSPIVFCALVLIHTGFFLCPFHTCFPEASPGNILERQRVSAPLSQHSSSALWGCCLSQGVIVRTEWANIGKPVARSRAQSVFITVTLFYCSPLLHHVILWSLIFNASMIIGKYYSWETATI